MNTLCCAPLITPEGVFTITENEVLHLRDGDLMFRINAVYDSNAPETAVASIHTITRGTGRYANATGFIQIQGSGWPKIGEADYVGAIRLAR